MKNLIERLEDRLRKCLTKSNKTGTESRKKTDEKYTQIAELQEFQKHNKGYKLTQENTADQNHEFSD